MTTGSRDPAAEGSPARIHPHRAGQGRRSSWLESPKTWVLLLAVSGVLCGLIAFGLLRPPQLPRPRAEFPVRPQMDAAIAAAQVRLQSDPQDLGALMELGLLHYEKGPDSYPEALNELEEARRLGALDGRIFYCLGRMYQELGLYPFAIEEYQKYLRNYSGDKEVRLLVAKLYYRQGDYNAAVKEYERLRFSSPDDQLVAENLGLSLWNAKQAPRAVEVFEQLKAAGGAPARRAQFYLGQIAFESGRAQEALDLMRGSLPADGEAEFGIPAVRMFAALAKVCQKLNRADEARDAWQRVLSLAPNDPEAGVALKNLNRRFPQKKPKKR